ncbi:hypothetical protein OIDMADRAFT_35289 [Oidiodendron maius Zn]|uniref:SMP-30/Gluconolactonase/LRE-like region domain-containing protein n=1 Tax=Oidiodendron maius (strain Zn) TaxID=913774 RepID=A0A0C3GCD1_OIDMZ|nr:hypothetical protein OIDMADRAFT_35289 [Oidiodendron maius Zn]
MKAIACYLGQMLVFAWASSLCLAGSTPSISTIFQLGTAGSWLDDLRGPSLKWRVAARVPDAVLFNGLTKWNNTSVLVADSAKGVIWKVDIETGASSIALSDPTMTIPTNASIQVGVNGVKVSDGFVYYTSTARQIFCRVPVDSSAAPTGPVEVVASGFPQDDFVIFPDGTAYVATNALNTIVKVTADGTVSLVAGSLGSLPLASDTDCQFGRTARDSNVLYVTTAGGTSDPVNGTLVVPAAVMAVELAGCES